MTLYLVDAISIYCEAYITLTSFALVQVEDVVTKRKEGDNMYSDEQKKIILSKNDFEVMEGCCFSNPTDQDYENHFVSKEEIEKALKEGYKTYFFKKDYDYIMNLEEAWENFTDYYWDENYEKWDEEMEQEMLKSLSKFLVSH